MWLAANKLTLNMTKTEFLLIGSKQRLNSTASPTATFSQFPIKQVSTVRRSRRRGVGKFIRILNPYKLFTSCYHMGTLKVEWRALGSFAIDSSSTDIPVKCYPAETVNCF